MQSFESYYTKNFESPPSIFNLTELEFRQRLTQYLFSKEGSRHRLMFRYHEELICGQPAPDIQVRQLPVVCSYFRFFSYFFIKDLLQPFIFIKGFVYFICDG